MAGKYKMVPCVISVGPAVQRGAAQELLLGMLTEHPGAVGFDPWRFCCRDCRLEWDTSSFTDISTVTCPNCYSTDVALIQVRLEF